MTKVSPIASILTQAKVTTKRNGNVCSFYTKEGLLIGTQLKIEQDGTNTYIRNVYNNGLKQLYRECLVIGQQCAYFKDNHVPIGLSLIPTKSCIITQTVDFIKNKIQTIEKEVVLDNKFKLAAVDEATGIGIYETTRPYLFKTKILEEKGEHLKKCLQKEHFTN